MEQPQLSGNDQGAPESLPARRDRFGRFPPGVSGNPTGKPVGRHPASVLLDALGEANAEAIVTKVVEMALGGDIQAAGLLFARIWPARKGRTPPPFLMPPLTDAASVAAALAAIVRAVSEGIITTAEADDLAKLVEMYAKALKLGQLEQRIAALENAL
jgi:hypothetical protein